MFDAANRSKFLTIILTFKVSFTHKSILLLKCKTSLFLKVYFSRDIFIIWRLSHSSTREESADVYLQALRHTELGSQNTCPAFRTLQRSCI